MTRVLRHPSVWLSTLIVLASAACGFFFVDDDAEIPERIGYASSVVTVVGALLAVYIFAWSRHSAAETTGLLHDVKNGQTLTANVVSDAPGPAPEGTQPAGSDDEPSTCIRLAGATLEQVGLERVPIRVFADLMELWRVEGGVGKRAFNDLDWIARKAGKGNHPWLLSFVGDDDVFRVAYGGKGRKGDRGIATRHPAPDDLAEVPCA